MLEILQLNLLINTRAEWAAADGDFLSVADLLSAAEQAEPLHYTHADEIWFRWMVSICMLTSQQPPSTPRPSLDHDSAVQPLQHDSTFLSAPQSVSPAAPRPQKD